MEYNTNRNHLVMKEYGRHIQRMVEYVSTLDDKEKREQQVQVIIELMGALNPHLKNVEDFRHMLWDHLFFISDFQLDVDSPYPIPTKETYKARPEPLPYPSHKPKFSHLGKHLESVIDKALIEENPDKKAGFASSIAYYMKLAYSNWHKENVHDDAIRQELAAMTHGQLDYDSSSVKHYKMNENRGGNYDNRDNRFKRGGDRQFRDNRGGGNQNRGGQNRDRDNRGGGGGRNKFGSNKKRF